MLRALDAICHNEVIRAEGLDRKYMARSGFWPRFLAHWFDLREHTIKIPESHGSAPAWRPVYIPRVG